MTRPEGGFVLVAVLFLVALILLSLAIAAPKVAVEIRRDKEEEAIHRGSQYVRAIRLYYKKFGKYPDRIEDLESSNNTRFLRKRYADPFTGKNDWRIIHFGEATVAQTGLFGQPIAGTAAGAAVGPGIATAPDSSGLAGASGISGSPAGATGA